MSKLKRLLFVVVYYLFASRLPASYFPGGRIFKAIRYHVCRHLFSACGKNVNVESGAFFHSGRNIRIGDNSDIGIDAKLFGTITIGSDVMMGPEVMIFTNNHHFSRTDIPINQQGFTNAEPVIIEDDVWIGARVIILAGVTIGRGAVIGAGAVIAKDIPDWAVAAGNPARVVRYRNPQANKLEETMVLHEK